MDLSSHDLNVKLDGNAISGYNANISLDSIVDSNDKEIAPDSIRKTVGTYKATYSVIIEYLGYTFDTKTVKQTVTVVDNVSNASGT